MKKSGSGIKVNDIKGWNNNDLINLLFGGLGSLERGMRGLDKNISTPGGKIDILALDMVGRIVIVEVEKEGAEDLLFKSIDHFDWALTNMEELEDKYKPYNIDPTLAPRILILAPSYSEKFIKRASYLNPTFIDIYEYQIKESLGIKKIYFRPFSFINHKKWVVDLRTKSLDDHLNYLEFESLKEILKSFLIEIQSLRNDFVIDTSKGYINFKNKADKTVLSIYVLKSGFWINLGTKRWNGYLIRTKEDLDMLKTQLLTLLRRNF